MRVDIDDAKKRLDEVRREIEVTTRRVEILQAEERDLETLLRMVQNYQIPREPRQTKTSKTSKRVATAETAPPPAPRGKSVLKRLADKRQTQIALELIQRFKPGEILTAQEAAKRFDDQFVHPTGKVQPGHYLSSFLIKEAQARNGVLVWVDPGHYTLREDAASQVALQ